MALETSDFNRVHDCAVNGHGPIITLEIPFRRAEGKWYRIQLVSKAEENLEDDNEKGGSSSKWCCRFLDVGGYGWVEAADLRKIRSDFLELPFQVGSFSAPCHVSKILLGFKGCFYSFPLRISLHAVYFQT